jgi:hypothetical protein
MTKNEFILQSSLKIGSQIVTNRGSIRKLTKFVQNQKGFGMLFRGIDSKSGAYNTIKRYIYLDEINSFLNYLYLNKMMAFKDVENFVKANKKGACVTHIAIVIVVNHLKLATVNYESKFLYLKNDLYTK